MVYGVLKLINFAHGDLFTMGAYLGLDPADLADSDRPPRTGAGVVLLLALMVMGLVALVGALLERVAYRPLRAVTRVCPPWYPLWAHPSFCRIP